MDAGGYRPPPRPRPRSLHGSPEVPSSSSSSSDEEDVGMLDHKRPGQGSGQGDEGGVAADGAGPARVEDAPVVVGHLKGPGPRKGSGLFTLKGEEMKETRKEMFPTSCVD